MPPVITPAAKESRFVIKRDGRSERFDPSKLIKWSEWAVKHIKGHVPWAKVVQEVLDSIQNGTSTAALQERLITRFLAEGTWNCNRMAGILWAPMLQKEYYSDGIPTIAQLHQELAEKGLMRKLNYTEAEYAELEEVINHDYDFEYAHFQLKQITSKYSVVDHVTKRRFETPQFVYMRMAMALAEKEPKAKRMGHVKNFYELLRKNILNAPTPNYIYLGTPLNGLVSCCLYTTDDNIPSLSTGNTIAYRMTAIGAGIGGFIKARGMGEAIRGGAILHNGKLPYFRSQAGDIKANMQSGRAGAANSYYNIFDVEASTIAQLQNPRTPQEQRNRDMHFTVQFHSLFLRKALADEKVFTFSCKSAPDLFDAFYGKDKEEFERLYKKYEEDENFPKNWISARELLVLVARQGFEVGTHYEFYSDNANHNTPFKEKIYSSNLCVAPETLIMTDEGEVQIQSKEGQMVNVWNGFEYSQVEVKKTGENKKLLKVTVGGGKFLECTEYHRWYIVSDLDPNFERQVETKDLKPGDKISPFKTPEGVRQYLQVVKIEDEGRVSDTYCFTEPKRHKGMFNGIVTGQCNEIYEPTHPYKDLNELFLGDYHYEITFKDSKGKEHTLEQKQVITKDGKSSKAALIQVGDVVSFTKNGKDWQVQVKEIVSIPQQPETALCSLGGIVAPNVHSDQEYDMAMYYALKMIDYCIHESSYPFEQIAFTAKQRLNAGVGLIGAATCLARKNLRYDTTEGLLEISKLAERHMYYAIKNSIKLGRERGNAPWIHKTRWTEGWLPIDTYSKTVDQVCPHVLHYDWEALRKELIDNQGMRFSCLVAHMPTESSSKAAGVPNGWLPVRKVSQSKSDSTNIIDWVAMDSDELHGQYQIAYSMSIEAQINYAAVVQKFTDQGFSFEIFKDRSQNIDLSATELIMMSAQCAAKGLKGRYYIHSKTDGDTDIAAKGSGCASGACTL